MAWWDELSELLKAMPTFIAGQRDIVVGLKDVLVVLVDIRDELVQIRRQGVGRPA